MGFASLLMPQSSRRQQIWGFNGCTGWMLQKVSPLHDIRGHLPVYRLQGNSRGTHWILASILCLSKGITRSCSGIIVGSASYQAGRWQHTFLYPLSILHSCRSTVSGTARVPTMRANMRFPWNLMSSCICQELCLVDVQEDVQNWYWPGWRI